MADIFLTYAHDDVECAGSLAEALTLEGWTVFWDGRIPPGRTFEDHIGQHLRECRAQVVLWSPHSVASKWVQIEAAVGRDRDILVPALIAETEIPFGYQHLHAADLKARRFNPTLLAFRELVSAIERLAPRSHRSAAAFNPLADEKAAGGDESSQKVIAPALNPSSDHGARGENYRTPNEDDASTATNRSTSRGKFAKPYPEGRSRRLTFVAIAATAAVLLVAIVWQASGRRSQQEGSRQWAPTLAKLQAACDSGDRRSCTTLGYAYELGQAVSKDEVYAVSLFRKGCDGGYASACNHLGYLYTRGRGGLPKDEARATAFYEKACDGGYPRGCTNLGYQYENGNGGFQKDDSRAVSLYQKACQDGDTSLGCSNLGYMYERGLGGLGKDEARAVSLYQKACESPDDYARGCRNLAWMYQNGRGGLAKDETRAVSLYRKSCESSDESAVGCHNLAWMYETGRGGLNQDVGRAIALYQKACDAGDADACEIAVRLVRPPSQPKS